MSYIDILKGVAETVEDPFSEATSKLSEALLPTVKDSLKISGVMWHADARDVVFDGEKYLVTYDVKGDAAAFLGIYVWLYFPAMRKAFWCKVTNTVSASIVNAYITDSTPTIRYWQSASIPADVQRIANLSKVPDVGEVVAADTSGYDNYYKTAGILHEVGPTLRDYLSDIYHASMVTTYISRRARTANTDLGSIISDYESLISEWQKGVSDSEDLKNRIRDTYSKMAAKAQEVLDNINKGIYELQQIQPVPSGYTIPIFYSIVNNLSKVGIQTPTFPPFDKSKVLPAPDSIYTTERVGLKTGRGVAYTKWTESLSTLKSRLSKARTVDEAKDIIKSWLIDMGLYYDPVTNAWYIKPNSTLDTLVKAGILSIALKAAPKVAKEIVTPVVTPEEKKVVTPAIEEYEKKIEMKRFEEEKKAEEVTPALKPTYITITPAKIEKAAEEEKKKVEEKKVEEKKAAPPPAPAPSAISIKAAAPRTTTRLEEEAVKAAAEAEKAAAKEEEKKEEKKKTVGGGGPLKVE